MTPEPLFSPSGLNNAIHGAGLHIYCYKPFFSHSLGAIFNLAGVVQCDCLGVYLENKS